MELQDPVVLYTAASNIEAHEIADMLQMQGIPAHVVEDNSPQSMWLGGLNTAIHKPRVWVSQADKEVALNHMREYDARLRLRDSANRARVDPLQTVVFSTCDRCGQEVEFPVAQSGTVQSCPHCASYMDVDPDPEFSDWDVGEPEATATDDEDTEQEDK